MDVTLDALVGGGEPPTFVRTDTRGETDPINTFDALIAALSLAPAVAPPPPVQWSGGSGLPAPASEEAELAPTPVTVPLHLLPGVTVMALPVVDAVEPSTIGDVVVTVLSPVVGIAESTPVPPVPAAPVQPAPVQPAPVEAAPVDVAPVDVAPTPAMPVPATPVQVPPVATSRVAAVPAPAQVAAPLQFVPPLATEPSTPEPEAPAPLAVAQAAPAVSSLRPPPQAAANLPPVAGVVPQQPITVAAARLQPDATPEPSASPAPVHPTVAPALNAPAMVTAPLAPAAPTMPVSQARPTTEDGQPLDVRLVEVMRWQAKEGGGRVEMKLRPEYLGAVTVTVHVEGGVVKASLAAESQATRDFLQAEAGHLRTALEDHGFTLETFEVRDDRETPDDHPHQRQHQPRSGKRPARGTAGMTGPGDTFDVVV